MIKYENTSLTLWHTVSHFECFQTLHEIDSKKKKCTEGMRRVERQRCNKRN